MAAKITKDAAGRVARRKAKAALAAKHPDEYKALVAQQLKALGFPAKAAARKPRTEFVRQFEKEERREAARKRGTK